MSVEYVYQRGVWFLAFTNVYVSEGHGKFPVIVFYQGRIRFVFLVCDCTSEEQWDCSKTGIVSEEYNLPHFPVLMTGYVMIEIKY